MGKEEFFLLSLPPHVSNSSFVEKRNDPGMTGCWKKNIKVLHKWTIPYIVLSFCLMVSIFCLTTRWNKLKRFMEILELGIHLKKHALFCSAIKSLVEKTPQLVIDITPNLWLKVLLYHKKVLFKPDLNVHFKSARYGYHDMTRNLWAIIFKSNRFE